MSDPTSPEPSVRNRARSNPATLQKPSGLWDSPHEFGNPHLPDKFPVAPHSARFQTEPFADSDPLPLFGALATIPGEFALARTVPVPKMASPDNRPRPTAILRCAIPHPHEP